LDTLSSASGRKLPEASGALIKDGEKATEEDIIKFCREKLAAYKAPKIVEFR